MPPAAVAPSASWQIREGQTGPEGTRLCSKQPPHTHSGGASKAAPRLRTRPSHAGASSPSSHCVGCPSPLPTPDRFWSCNEVAEPSNVPLLGQGATRSLPCAVTERRGQGPDWTQPRANGPWPPRAGAVTALARPVPGPWGQRKLSRVLGVTQPRALGVALAGSTAPPEPTVPAPVGAQQRPTGHRSREFTTRASLTYQSGGPHACRGDGGRGPRGDQGVAGRRR